jgi:endonuclease/exonuclease/phosphatase family metal-dependent hydrolase
MSARHLTLPLPLVLLLMAGLSLPLPAGPAQATLRLATWNLEWLLTPATAQALQRRCRGGHGAGPRQGRQLPCDIVAQARSEADFRALAHRAALLDADVIALQEVENEAAAARVFAGYRFCLTARRDWQNVGFAVRRGLEFRCGPDVLDLSVGDRVRRGAQLTLFPGAATELRLLAVHLKSGCSRESLAATRGDCTLLARQAPALAAWIDTQVAAGRAFAVLGDFNRDLRREVRDGGGNRGSGLWQQLTDGQPRPERLQDASSGTPFLPCHAGQNFTGYIDYILLGGGLATRRVPGSFARHPFPDREALRHRLSDHCPLSVVVALH